MTKTTWKALAVTLCLMLIVIFTFAATQYIEVLTIGTLAVNDDFTVGGNSIGTGTLVQTGSITSAAGLDGSTLTLTGTSFVWDPGSLNDGTQTASSVTVSGSAFGDAVIVGAGIDVQDILVSATVTAADTVTVVIQNETAGTIDLGTSTWYVYVILDD